MTYPAKKLRTARLSVATAIQQALESIEILRKLSGQMDDHMNNVLDDIKKQKFTRTEPEINMDGHDLAIVIGALRDYITLRIANIVDPHPSSKSLKDYPDVDLKKVRSIPQVQAIIRARDNWIGHINKRFIGPVDKQILWSKEVVGLLKHLEMLVCTNSIREREDKS